MIQVPQWSIFWTQVRSKEMKIVDLADANQLRKLKTMLEVDQDSYPFDINAGNGLNGWNAVHYAVFNDNIEMLKLVLNYGGKLEQLTTHNSTPLHLAVQIRSLKMSKFLIKQGVDVNIQDNDLNTPLHYASERGLVEISKLLLESGSNPNIRNSFLLQPAQLVSNNLILEIFNNFGIDMSSPRQRQMINGVIIMNSIFDKKRKLLNSIRNLVTTIYRSATSKINVTNLVYVSKLGQGSFGDVYQVYDEQKDEHYAMKCLRIKFIMSQDALKYAETERKILKMVRSPFIARLKGSFQNSTHLFLLEEYIPGYDLDKYLKNHGKFQEALCAQIIAQVLLGLKDIHDEGYIYRDLKPHNIMLQSNGAVKLVDFGLSKESDEKCYSFCGTVAYLAPEMVKRQGHTISLDYYLLGVVMYELLHGETPYFARVTKDIYHNILHGEIHYNDTISDVAKSLLQSLLKRDPRERPKFNEVKQHLFFQNVNFDQLKNLHKSYLTIDKPLVFLPQIYDLTDRSDKIIKNWDWNVSY